MTALLDLFGHGRVRREFQEATEALMLRTTTVRRVWLSVQCDPAQLGIQGTSTASLTSDLRAPRMKVQGGINKRQLRRPDEGMMPTATTRVG